MILTCPQCATRYQVDGAKFPAAGRNVRCAKCGNVWHQLGPVPEPDPEAELMVEEPPARRQPEPEPSYEAAPADPHAHSFVPTRSAAEETEVAAPPRARTSWLGRIALATGWLLLSGLVLAIGWVVINFRENVAIYVPQTASFYAAAGLPVSPRGMDLTDIGYNQKTEDGQRVLTVTGRIINRSTHELSVPPVRVVLFDTDRHELYRWTTVAGASSLKAGAVTNFHARLASPPSAMHDLEVRFARAGE